MLLAFNFSVDYSSFTEIYEYDFCLAAGRPHSQYNWNERQIEIFGDNTE